MKMYEYSDRRRHGNFLIYKWRSVNMTVAEWLALSWLACGALMAHGYRPYVTLTTSRWKGLTSRKALNNKSVLYWLLWTSPSKSSGLFPLIISFTVHNTWMLVRQTEAQRHTLDRRVYLFCSFKVMSGCVNVEVIDFLHGLLLMPWMESKGNYVFWFWHTHSNGERFHRVIQDGKKAEEMKSQTTFRVCFYICRFQLWKCVSFIHLHKHWPFQKCWMN